MRHKNIAVIGCGYWGKNLVRNFHNLNTLHTVCDATESGRTIATELAPTASIVHTVQAVIDIKASSLLRLPKHTIP